MDIMETAKNKIIYLALIFVAVTFSTNLYAEPKAENVPEAGTVSVIRATEIGQEKWTFDDYRIANGDVLKIAVWKVEELQGNIIVRPDGKISFPLVGDLKAAGRTIAELSEDITQKLKVYIKNPQVSVMVQAFGGRKVITMGEISSPGIIRFTEPIRIMEALALSGSYLESACLSNVLVIRGDLRNHTKVIVVDVTRILKGHFEENIYMDSNDIIYLPRSIIGNIAYLIRQIGPLFGAADTYFEANQKYFETLNKRWVRGTSKTEDSYI